MLIKQKIPSLPSNLALRTFGDLLIVFSTKVNLLQLLYSMTWRCCILHLIKQNCLLKTVLRTLILMTWYLFIFPSRTTLKLHNISVTRKMVKKVIINFYFIGPDCILVVVLKICEPELLYVLAEFFNKCLMIHWWSLYLRMLGKCLQLKTTTLFVFFLWLVKS